MTLKLTQRLEAFLPDPMRAAEIREAIAQIERDEVDASRWRALMSSARMHWMGSAGFDFTLIALDGDQKALDNSAVTPRPDTPLHFGMEFWDQHSAPSDGNDRFCRRILEVYVDHIRSKS